MAERAIIRVAGGAVELRAERQANPASVYLASLAPVGRRGMAVALDRVARLCGFDGWDDTPWTQLRFEHVQAIVTKLAEEYAPATVNHSLAAMRGVLKAAWQMGQIDAEHYHKAKSVRGVTGSRLPAGRAVSSGELAAMMKACQEDETDAGRRDAAIIAVAYAAGLRRAELAGLALENLVDDDGETMTLWLVGKRNKERLCYLDNGSMAALRAWLKVRGRRPGPLFWRGRKGGHLTKGADMTPQAIRGVIVRRAKQAGVEDLTPHDLRRSFVSDLLDAGIDLATVSYMAGHASVQTTARYDRRGEQAKKRAARSLHVPYTRRE